MPQWLRSFVDNIVSGTLIAPFLALVATLIYYRLTAAHAGEPYTVTGPEGATIWEPPTATPGPADSPGSPPADSTTPGPAAPGSTKPYPTQGPTDPGPPESRPAPPGQDPGGAP